MRLFCIELRFEEDIKSLEYFDFFSKVGANFLTFLCESQNVR